MRFGSVLVVLTLLLALVAPVSAAPPPLRVVIDGQELRFDVPPQNIGGRTMVPLRKIFEALGATVEWDDATKTVTATKGDVVVVLTVGTAEAKVKGRTVTLDQPAQMIEGRTLVPARFVAEALGALVSWDGPTQTVNIGSGHITRTGAQYKAVTNPPTGWLTTGQSADLMLSGIGFGQTGGPLLFNHPGAVTSDGTHLIMADNWNNRVLIWNQLPDGNVAPDIVLGQPDFNTNWPGTGLDQMNWPVGVATGGGRLVVADTYNDRLLIWTTIPTVSGAPADFVVKLNAQGRRYFWPWAVWTDGRRLMVTSTAGDRGVLVWNTFPTKFDQAPDMVITANRLIGTPRTIISDGKSLLVGDHDAKVGTEVGGTGTYVWKQFPTSGDQPYDYFIKDPKAGMGWLGGAITPDGKLVALGKTLYVWNSLPRDGKQAPDVMINGYDWGGGDGQNLVVVGNRVYVSSGYSNKLAVYRSIPTQNDQLPDFVIGAPDLRTNTLTSNYFIHNPNVISNGKKLLVLSDVDRTLSIWEHLPDESGAHPDRVIAVPGEDMALHGEILAIVASDRLFIWDNLQFDDGHPDRTIMGPSGVPFKHLTGVAMDDRYTYVADGDAGKLYVYGGLPQSGDQPAFTIDIEVGRTRLASDGKYLVVTRCEPAGTVRYALVDYLSAQSRLDPPFLFPYPMYALPAAGHLFVVENWTHQVLVWNKLEDINKLGRWGPDLILGGKERPGVAFKASPDSETWLRVTPQARRDTLFMPWSVSFDGSYLWVGEYKFSGRLLRYSVGQ